MVTLANLKVQHSFDQIKLSSISSLEELDFKVLVFQNKKLAERIDHKRRVENELRSRIDQLEQKIVSNDAVLCLTNRYWNQLDENLKIILERMDIDFHLEKEKYMYENHIDNTLNSLEHDFNKIVGKHLKKEKDLVNSDNSGDDINMAIASDSENEKSDTSEGENDTKRYLKNINIPKLKYKEGQKKNLKKLKYKSSFSSSGSNSNIQHEFVNKSKFAYNYFIEELFSCDQQALDEKHLKRIEFTKNILVNIVKQMETFYILRDDLIIKMRGNEFSHDKTNAFTSLSEKMGSENKNLRSMITRLHAKMHKQNLWHTQLKDQLKISENTNDELKNRIQDLEYEHEKAMTRESKFNNELIRLSETCQKYNQELEILRKQNKELTLNISASVDKPNTIVEDTNIALTSIPLESFKEIEFELKQQSNLAENRLAELEKLHNEHLHTLKEMEQLKIQLKSSIFASLTSHDANDIENFIKTSDGYRSLQSQFSIVFNENSELKAQSKELRKLLQSIKIVHVQQMEELAKIQGENVKKFQEDAKLLQDNWLKAKREHDLLKIEYEQFLSTKEQTGSSTQETKITIASLQEHNRQLKREILRYKKKNAIHHSTHGPSKEATPSHPQPPPPKFVISSHCDSNTLPHHAPTSTTPDDVSCDEKTTNASTQPKHGRELALEQHGPTPTPNKGNVKSEVLSEDVPMETASAESIEPINPAKKKKLSTTSTPLEGSGSNNEEKNVALVSTSSTTTSLLSCIVALTAQTPLIPMPNNVKDLKEELKKSYAAQKELKLLLDVYKNASRDQRDKAEMLVLERKLTAEIGELREKLALSATESEPKDACSNPTINTPPLSHNNQQTSKNANSSNLSSSKIVDLETSKKLSQCEERLNLLQKKLYDTKQEEEALLKELEVTGQAFEDMQEQNIRLLQQLREKDDANFKLISERIKANQMQKAMKEEKETYISQQLVLKKQIENLNDILLKFKEKEKILQTSLTNSDREANLRYQAAESYKKRAIEAAQLCSDLRVRSDKLTAQMNEYRDQLTERTAALEREAFKINRLKEELNRLKDKLKYKKLDEQSGHGNSTLEQSNYAAGGIVGKDLNEAMLLNEEVKALKESMTCPSCKSQRKDAVLSKCFHVFCYQCLKTRYDTRQRKCPKCAAPFGANDFHRLFLY